MSIDPSRPAPKHAFISYVKEDVREAIALQEALEASGINVWRDKDNLWPGMDWAVEIRKAIRSGSMAFIACFSHNSAAREVSYQNEELVIAVEEFRKRPPGAQWLFPVRFGDVTPPDFDLGAGRTFGSLHFTDLFGSAQLVELIRLTTALTALLKPQATAGTVATYQQATSAGDFATRDIKTLLRDPNGDIALEESVNEVANDVRKTLEDETMFPKMIKEDDDQTALGWIERVEQTLAAYERAVDPLLKVFLLAGLYGLPQHEHIWAGAMSRVATSASIREGNRVLNGLREYPLIMLMYAATLTATSRGNYGVIRAIATEPEVRVSEVRVPVVRFANVRGAITDFGWMASGAERFNDGTYARSSDMAEDMRTRRVGNLLTPLSDRLARVLYPYLEDRFVTKEDFEEALDVTEVLLDSLSAHVDQRTEYFGGYWLGGGRYTWRHSHNQNPPEARLAADLEKAGESWKPLRAGLFDGDVQGAKKALQTIVESAARIRREHW